MKCLEAQEQLSAYHDGELADEIHSQVATHVATCDECARRLAEFASYSETFKKLPQPEVPAAVWDGIADHRVDPARDLRPESERRSWRTVGVMSLAASVLLLVGVGVWTSQHSEHSDPHHAEFAMTMDHYLKTLSSDPDAAEKFLLDKYNGQTVDPEDAVKLVGYRPAVASGLPEDYTLASTSVMKMPCCTCVKAVCKRKDGSTLVLFEHDDEEAELLGDRPFNMATCGDTECCLVDLDSSIAATWKRGSRWVTAVGVRDEAEIGELVTWLEDKTSIETQPL